MRPLFPFAEPFTASETGGPFIGLDDNSDEFPNLLHHFFGLMTPQACYSISLWLNY